MKLLGGFNQFAIVLEPPAVEGTKMLLKQPGHMSSLDNIPINCKIYKLFFSRTPEPVAFTLGICYWIPNYFQDLQMMTFGGPDLFIARSNMENAGTSDFMERFKDLGLRIGTHNCLNEYIMVCEDRRSKSFFEL